VGRDVFRVAEQRSHHRGYAAEGEEFKLARRLDVSHYTTAMKQLDEDFLTELVLEVGILFRFFFLLLYVDLILFLT
jgi:hypothetical protein